MIPATHAAAGAAATNRFRNVALALIVSFGLHYVLDALYHFEGFYELSVPGGWTYERTMFILFTALIPLAAPIAAWLWWKNRQVGWFACYAFLLSMIAFEPSPAWRLIWAGLLSAGWWLVARTSALKRWALCGLAAYLPDCLKGPIPALGWLHEAMHHRPELDLGDWVSLLVRGRWRIPLNSRAFDPYYQIGYAIEILFEAAILFGCLYLLVRWSVADLAAVHHQRGAVDKRSFVGK